jgi:hypothetical protein
MKLFDGFNTFGDGIQSQHVAEGDNRFGDGLVLGILSHMADRRTHPR